MQLGPNQRKWVEALRSGQYQQGRNKLCRINVDGTYEYCCLGVACEIFNIDYVDYMKCRYYKNYDVSLPSDVVQLLALRDSEGLLLYALELLDSYYSKYRKYQHLSAINDGSTCDFKNIADLLEYSPELFFTESK